VYRWWWGDDVLMEEELLWFVSFERERERETNYK
jgi:hypothetical protein